METKNNNNPELNINSKCSRCLWGDKCQSKVAGKYCDNYYSTNEDDQDEILVEEYQISIEERYGSYQEIIDELNEY